MTSKFFESDLILIGINFNTSNLIDDYIKNWRSKLPNIKIIIVDNFSNDKERKDIRYLANKLHFNILESENNGYSSGILKGIELAKKMSDNPLILAGNIDIECSYINLNFFIEDNEIPWPKIIDKKTGRNISCMHSDLGEIIMPIADLAAKRKSKYILKIYILLSRLIRPLYRFSKPWSPHGSLFIITPFMLKHIDKFFKNSIFLYCEEYIFGKGIRKLHLKRKNLPITIIHKGKASTATYQNQDKYLRVWSKSWLEARKF